jgi:murein L,D-transpeptidase YafK
MRIATHGWPAVLLIVVSLMLQGCSSLGLPKDKLPLSQSTVRALASLDTSPAAPMLVRIFKQSAELEVWKPTSSGDYSLFKRYPICKWSGELGPKIKEGDYQSPEGFYSVTPGMMNPKSGYYLSFNTGFPNKYDRAYGRTGTNLMVHGDCKSVGCYAMTDDQIREIYALARESFAGGNPSFQLELYPFRMTEENLAKQSNSPHVEFWRNLKEGFDEFERTRRPAAVDVCGGRYVFNKEYGSRNVDPLAQCPPTIQPGAQT